MLGGLDYYYLNELIFAYKIIKTNVEFADCLSSCVQDFVMPLESAIVLCTAWWLQGF